MLAFSIFIFWSVVISLFLLCLIITGEYYAGKYPNSKFKKWWSRNVVSEINYYEDEI